MTVVLGLDLGTKSGFARYDTESRELLLGWNDWGKLPPEDRIVGFGEWLFEILGGKILDVRGQIEQVDLAPIEVIGFERVSFSGPGKGGEYIARQEGVLQYVGRDVAWQGVEVPTLKKFALRGTAPKRLILKGVPKGEASRLRAGQRKLVKGMMIQAARRWIIALGLEAPETMKDDTADALLVLCWVLKNSLPGWTL